MDKLNITNITAKRESLSDINIFRAQQNRDDDIDLFDYTHIHRDGFGFDARFPDNNDRYRGEVEITYEQFKKYVMNKDTFVLPKNWCVKGIVDEDDSNLSRKKTDWWDYFNSLANKSDFGFYNNAYYYIQGLHGYHKHQIPQGYTEITFEQFIEYVVKPSMLNNIETLKEVIKEEEVINPAKGFSMSQFAQALESIPWMEKDDAKDIYKEVEKHFKSIKIEEEVIT